MRDQATTSPTTTGDDRPAVAPAPLRPAAEVMRLARMGAAHQTRLSFVRGLVRRMAREGWTIACKRLDIGADERGEAVYTVDTPQGRYSFVVFAQDLDPAQRTDRVIAERWDHTFALCEGEPDAADMDRLRRNVPRQEAGRMCSRDLVLSRGNKSVRLFGEVVRCLSAGRQPDIDAIGRVGYLMRTTAVYGNGKFGLADYERLRRGTAFPQPFSAQMLTVYLARQFSLDLVDHLARLSNPEGAAALSPDRRRAFGVGNATGLGMAPFLVSHPRLIHRWTWARESAIARVKGVERAAPAEVARFQAVLDRAIEHVGEWHTDDPVQQARNATLRQELATLRARWGTPAGPGALLARPYPWQALAEAVTAETSLETQELVHALMLEPYGWLVDDLAGDLAAEETPAPRPAMTLDDLKRLLERDYAWALAVDYETPEATHFFWYRSETKEEPRLGVRHREPGADREMAIGIGRAAARLHDLLCTIPASDRRESVAAFLLRHLGQRWIVRRVQALADCPYGEVRDNLLGAGLRPIDLLRFKLAFFGAVKFDPKSDRWTRITLFQGAPLPEELADPARDPDDWVCPVLGLGG